MSEAKPYFIHQKAKKQSGEPSAVFWESAKSDTRALRDAENALEDADKDPANYFKAVVTNFPVVDELPPEGEISFTFCNFFQPGADGMTWEQIPGVSLPPRSEEKIVEGTDTTIVDGVDTATGEVVGGGENAPQADGELPPYDRLAIFNKHTFEQKIFGTWLFGLFTELSTEQKNEVMRLSMDRDQAYPQNVFLAANDFELRQLQHVFPETYANLFEDTKSIWPENGKSPRLESLLKFFGEWLNAINNSVRGPTRPEVVEKWQKKCAQPINRTPSGANAGGGNKTDRLTPQTAMGLEYEITLGLLARRREFDIYNPPLEVDAQANAIMNLSNIDDSDTLDEFLATRELFSSMPGGMDYSRACNVATVKTTPDSLWRDRVKHREYLNRVMTETDHAHPDELIVDIACGRSSMTMPMASKPEQSTSENASNEGAKPEVETTSDVQIQTSDRDEKQAGNALQSGEVVLLPGEGTGSDGMETAVTSNAEILAAAAPLLANQDQAEVNQKPENVSQNSDSVNHNVPETAENVPDVKQTWPTTFEPGRYENVPNEVYHAANGISSTQLKDARISLMRYHGRHIAKTIPREETDALIRGRIIHGLALEPEKFEEEFAIPAEMPKDVVSTSGDMVNIIKAYNAALPSLMTPDELKAWIENHNSTLTPPLSLSASAEETGMMYMSLPVDFQRIPAETKPTASAQKACIKEYNASLPPMLKMSGTRDQLLEQIATVAPDFAEAERAKFVPYNISGTKEQLTEIARSIRPDIVTADDWREQQESASAGKTVISLDMYAQATRISEALQANPDSSWLLNNPDRQSEVSYFGIDEETGLEIRVRPDIEVRLPHEGICGDLKSVSLGYIRQDRLKERLHREIIERDYHLSAAMYCDVAGLDRFVWVFVNKDEGYHWVAVVEASKALLELGRKEYRRVLRQINEAMENDKWPAPITETYIDDLTDFDLRRLESLEAE